MILTGLPNDEIAGVYFTAPSTVKGYLGKICDAVYGSESDRRTRVGLMSNMLQASTERPPLLRVENMVDKNNTPLEHFNERKIGLVGLVSEGLSYAAIGHQMGKDASAVKADVNRLTQKVGVPRELIVAAYCVYGANTFHQGETDPRTWYSPRLSVYTKV